MPLSNLAGLYGILEGISAGTDIQRQQQQLRQREQLFQQEQAQQRLQGQALAGLLSRTQPGGAQGGGMALGQQPMIPPAPAPQPQPQQPQPLMAPNLAGSNVNWQGEQPQFRQRVSDMLQAAPPDVRAGSSVDSGYRTTEQQADIYRRSGQGTQFAAAPPGKSLHEQGLAADWQFANPQADQWVHQNAGRFGLGFPLGARDPNHMQLAALRNDTTQAGMAALQAGVPQPAARDMVQTGQAAINELDPRQFGVYSLPQVAQAVEKAAGPDTDPVVKSMAIGGLMKLLQPQDQMYYRARMQENRDLINIWKTTYTQAEQDARLRALEMGRDVRAGERAETGGTMQLYQPPGGGPPLAFNTKTGSVTQPQLPAGSTRMPTGAGGGAGAEPSASAVDFWVKVLQQGGSLPPNIGRGRAGQSLVTAVMDKIGQTGADPGDFISAQATRKADASSLQKATAMSDAAIGFEETALKNLEIATKQLHDVAPTDLGPAINKWIETGEQALGDPSVPASVTSVLTFANEYAKVMSGATGGQGATVDARREAAQLFNPYFSTGQWDRVKAIATADMNNRKAALTENIDRIKSRLSGKPQQQSKEPAAARQQADTQPVPDSLKNEDDGVTIRNKSDGSLWIKRGDRLIRAPAGAAPTPEGQP